MDYFETTHWLSNAISVKTMDLILTTSAWLKNPHKSHVSSIILDHLRQLCPNVGFLPENEPQLLWGNQFEPGNHFSKLQTL